ncbi:MAG TPA: cbb3-type cytochrome c oxidase N-terminal domain-containing protein [Polyangiaceae bacterium]|nr:cbb3-type cytochrome c oxidase N-terminal domain-containing protein [Polyangiaceae bacterium]
MTKARDEIDVLDHEYDGIKEYDNPLPRWWVLTCWASFWFSLAYFGYYHVFDKGESVAATYQREQIAAREQRLAQSAKQQVSEAGLSVLVADSALVADAKLLYGQRCAVCHGPDGQGQIGPNLSDGSWLHGRGELTQIYTVISEGVPSKGMPTWQAQLSPVELQKLTAFVGSLRGKNLQGKAPEGTPIGP